MPGIALGDDQGQLRHQRRGGAPSSATGYLASLDEAGRLLHEDDFAAQMALGVARLEAALAAAGRATSDLVGLKVLTTDAGTLHDVLDVLTEGLVAMGATPDLRTQTVERLDVPGLLFALEPTLSETTTPTSEGTTMSTIPALSPAAALRGLCDGRVHLPGDPGYDAARSPWNVAVDQRPAAVAVPHTVSEVQEVVRAAAAAGLRVAPQSTGHNAGPLGERPLDDVVIVRLSELTGVVVDPEARVARVTGGTLWQEVVEAAAAHGLTALHGSSPDVAVAGFTLGGGLSFYARQHGLAAGSILAAEVVTADGSLVRADAEHHADLLWALRGGGGNLGVVVSLEIALLDLPDVVSGMLLWDAVHADAVVRAWARWTRDLPESVTTSLRVMSFPPLPDLPPFLSGRQLVVIDGAVLEDDARAAELLAPLRQLAPEMDTFARIPAAGVLGIHMDPPGPTPAVSDHAVLREVTDETVTALLSVVGPGTGSSLLFAELRHLGGALSRPAAGGGALPMLHGGYALFCIAIAPFPEAAAQGLADAATVVRALAPWSTATRVLNFTEQQVDASSGYDGEDWARLCAVRDRFDPTGLLLANHALP